MSALPTPPQDFEPFSMPVPSISLELPDSAIDEVQAAKDKLWDDLARIYDENADTIRRAAELDAEGIANQGGGKLQRAVDGFGETAKVVCEALAALSNIHPAIGFAVFAFHSVISLDASRRDNDRKVAVVKMQMQSMMCALFQLRNLRLDHFGDKEDPSKDYIHFLIKSMANEIKRCGSDLTYYSGKPPIAKFLKSKVYEGRFAEHTAIFSERRSELQTLFASYSSSGITLAMQKQTEADDLLKGLKSKVDQLAASFERLATPQEAEAAAFIAKNDGIERCIDTDGPLRKLLVIFGQPISLDKGAEGTSLRSTSGPIRLAVIVEGQTVQDATPTRDSSSLDQLRKERASLRAEHEADLKKAFKDHEWHFEAMLKVQNNNLERISNQLHLQGATISESNANIKQVLTMNLMMLEEGKLIKKALLPPRLSKIHIKDPMLYKLWEAMELKANVKAKHFVFGLRDHLLYHTDISSAISTLPPTPLVAFPTPDGGFFPIPDPRHSLRVSIPPRGPSMGLIRIQSEERWVLQYLDVLHVQPILEAMDEDGSGFISVHEASRFAVARPHGFSLLRWLAYWAAGWHLTLTTYRSKIYRLLQQIYRKLSPPSSTRWNGNHDLNFFANRYWVEHYIEVTQDRLDMLLRSTRPYTGDTVVDEHLLDLAVKITKAKEARIEGNLKDMGYVIRSPQAARLVIGVDRIESSIYPLLYLLISRHLLGQSEFLAHIWSILHVFTLFDDRILNLKATFSQVHRDVDRQFENFAYGMFFASLKEKDCWPPVYVDKMTILQFNEFNEPLDLGPESPTKAQESESKGQSEGENRDQEQVQEVKDNEANQVSILQGAPADRPDIPYVDQDIFRNAMRARSLGFLDDVEVRAHEKPVGQENGRMGVEGGDALDVCEDTHTSARENQPVDESLPDHELTPIVRALCGYWTVAVTSAAAYVSYYRLWHCVLTPGSEPGVLCGTGESMCGPVELKGNVSKQESQVRDSTHIPAEDPIPQSQPRYGVHLEAVVPTTFYQSMRIHATYNVESDEIEGRVEYFETETESGVGSEEGAAEETEPVVVSNEETPEGAGVGNVDANTLVDSPGVDAPENRAIGTVTETRGPEPNYDKLTAADDGETPGDDKDLQADMDDRPQETTLPPQPDLPPQTEIDSAQKETSLPPPKTNNLDAIPEPKTDFSERISFTRTPVQFYRFKNLLDTPPGTTPSAPLDPNSIPAPTNEDTAEPAPLPAPHKPHSEPTLARRRWDFACQAVRHHVQEKLSSKAFIKERLLERKLWLKMSMDFKLDAFLGQDGTAQFSPNAWQQLTALRASIPPCNSRLYDATAIFLLQRGVHFVGSYYCDCCRATIRIGERHHCITCVSDSYWNQVDLCRQCLDQALLKDNTDYIRHLPTHSLIRSRKVLPFIEEKSLIDNAKEKATRIKAKFRTVEKEKEVVVKEKESGGSGEVGKGSSDSGQTQTNTTVPTCGCCEEVLSVPCWVCLECDHDTFICVTCDTEHTPLVSGVKEGETRHPSYDFHMTRHHMLLIRTSENISARKPTPQTEVAKLEKRLEDVEGRLQTHLQKQSTTLEQQFNERVQTLEEKIVHMEERMAQIESKIDASSQRAEERMSTQGALVEERMDRVIGLLERLASGLSNRVV